MAAPFLARVVRGTTPTSTGTKTFEAPGVGTPVGAVVIATLATSGSSGADGLSTSWGVTDGTRHGVTFGYSRHNVGTSVAKSGGDTTGDIFRLYDPADGSIIVEGSWDSWSTNGIVIDFTTVDASAYQIGIILFGGGEADAYVFSGRGSSFAPTTITTGFATDFSLTNIAGTVDGTEVNNYRFQPGIAGPGDLNAMSGIQSGDGFATTETRRFSYSDRVAQGLTISSGSDSLLTSAIIDTYTGTGFDLTSSGSAGPRILGIALNTGSVDVHIEVSDQTLSAAGIDNITAPSHESDFVYLPLSTNNGADDTKQNFASMALGVSDFQDEFCVNVIDAENQSTTNSESFLLDRFIELRNHSGSAVLFDIDVASQASGFDLDYTAPNVTKRRFRYLSIEKSPAEIVSPTGIPSEESWGTPVVAVGGLAQEVTPAGIASAEAWGTPSLSTGAVVLSPGGIASEESWGIPIVSPRAVALSPGGVASAESWGAPALAVGVVILSPGGAPSAEAWGTPIVSPGAFALSPGGVISAESWGTPILATGVVALSPSGIVSAESWGTPIVNPGAIIVTPTGIVSAESWGLAVLAQGQVVVSPTGIASEESWGLAVLSQGQVVVSPTGIVSAESWGTPILAPGSIVLSPGGIASEESWGFPILVLGLVTVQPSSVPSAESWGTPIVAPGSVVLAPGGIVSAESWGIPILTAAGAVVLVPAGIPSAESWGIPLLSGGTKTILVVSIPSAESWGIPFLLGGVIPLTMKKLIYDALIARAKAGTFIQAIYDNATCTLTQGGQMAPSSIEANELSSVYKTERQHGRAVVQDRAQWQWLLTIRFNDEVITEQFEESLLDSPVCILRDPGAGVTRQITLKMIDASYNHPPRQGASNGTDASFRFAAELSRK